MNASSIYLWLQRWWRALLAAPTLRKLKRATRKKPQCFYAFLSLMMLIIILISLIIIKSRERETIIDVDSVKRDIEKSLREALDYDKGRGCEIPQFDPFSKEIMAFNFPYPKVQCGSFDWVKCYLSECAAVEEIVNSVGKLSCTYRDIVYNDDRNYRLGPATVVPARGVYTLRRSDHVKIQCTGSRKGFIWPSRTWTGHGIGYRTDVRVTVPPAEADRDREGSLDILIFGFDSASKNGFIRKMPKSYNYLKNELGATFLNGYTVLGDGTKAALFPLLSGKHELEFPNARIAAKIKKYLPADEFIFSKLKQYGYRTAYYEDSPKIGTFQYRFNGFSEQPADHYLRAVLEEDDKSGRSKDYCFGDTPMYRVMMNLTDQFLKLPGKHFIFTLIVDISHDNFNMISMADDDTVHFLDNLKRRRVFDNTMLLFMGDHGIKFTAIRQTFQGKYEERLPLMAIVLPKVLKERRPKIQGILENNTDVLTTPHDIHTTVLDALDLMHLRNTYRVPGADMDRALTLFEPIPKNRSCSTAGIESHWCVCVSWENVTHTDVLYHRAAEAFVDYVNSLTEQYRGACARRALAQVWWVHRRRFNRRVITFVSQADSEALKGKFNESADMNQVFLQIKVSLDPAAAVFEASTTYLKHEDTFIFNTRDISRTSMYRNEPDCIRETHPELLTFCYCTDVLRYTLKASSP